MLRQEVRPDQVAEHSIPAPHEPAMSERVEAIATPTPRLFGVDPTGERAGTPVVLMTDVARRRAGVGRPSAIDPLVDVLVDVAVLAVAPATATTARRFAVHAQEWYTLPKSGDEPLVWEPAIEISEKAHRTSGDQPKERTPLPAQTHP